MDTARNDLTTLLKSATDLNTPIYVGPTEPKYKYFNSIENRDQAKPWGGLWTAPASETDYDISPYTKYENRALVQPHHEVWELSPKENTTVVLIDTTDKLNKLPTYQSNWTEQTTYLDYEQIFNNSTINGIHIVGDVAHRNAFSKNHNLGSWDFTSTLWDSLEWIESKTKHGLVEEYA